MENHVCLRPFEFYDSLIFAFLLYLNTCGTCLFQWVVQGAVKIDNGVNPSVEVGEEDDGIVD